MDRRSNSSQASKKRPVIETACAVFSVLFLSQLVYRALIDHVGAWFARSCVMIVLPALTLLGMALNIAQSISVQSRIIRLCFWIVIGISYMDIGYVTDSVSEKIFSSVGLHITDAGILTRGAFLALAGSWMPAICNGFLLVSYINSLFSRKKEAFLTSIGIHALCSAIFLVWMPEPPYPDCAIPLLGCLIACVGITVEMPKGWRFLRSIFIVSGIAYACNSYLSCSYCGMVEPNSETRRQLHVIWKCPLRSGNVLQIIEGVPNGIVDQENSSSPLHIRAMRLGHSVMGGIWTKPESVYGVSIFSAFHLQATGALFISANKSRTDKKSLHVGLGAGTSLKLLQELGYSCNCIELHPEIVVAAKEFFNVHGAACQVGDAGQTIHQTSLEKYDIINVDIFSGDTDMSLLKKHAFFRTLSRLMIRSDDSVLVVNYFGIESQQLKRLYSIVAESFAIVRIFKEEQDDDAISNFVLVASNSRNLNEADPVPVLESEPYSTIFQDHKDALIDTLRNREISATRGIRSRCSDYRSLIELFSFKACVWRENLLASGAQWRSFRRHFS